MPNPPQLTQEQRQAALAKATAQRAAISKFRNEVKEGKHGSDYMKIMKSAAESDQLKRMKVSSFLEALPGIGKVKSKAIMERIGISPARRLQGLGNEQFRKLDDFFKLGM